MSSQEHRRNIEIRATEIRLIDELGEMKGVISRAEALRQAEEQNLDLVEIQPNAEPPVCRIMDYGKFKYEQQKKAAVARKHQKQIETKEIQFRPLIENHDYQTKLTHIREFLSDGNKVRLVVRLRGRERSSPELGKILLDRLVVDLSHDAQFDSNAAGRPADGQFLVVASPLPKAAHKAKAPAI